MRTNKALVTDQPDWEALKRIAERGYRRRCAREAPIMKAST